MGKLYHGSTLIIDGSGGSAPVGAIMPYGGSTAPTGWLLCDGSAVSRTTYAALYAVIGTTYGSGDGNTSFNLPDFSFILKGVKGTGMTLGLTNGITNYGISPNGGSQMIIGSTAIYGKPINTEAGGYFTGGAQSLGITLDSTKSGIESDIENNTKYIIKY